MKLETKTKILLIEQQIAQAHSTLQTWTQTITHYQSLLKRLTQQLKQVKNKIKK